MFPFWGDVVAPVLEAAGARRIVEIGALRGEQTQLILDRLGADGELHVIDPVPDFDPDEHRRRFGPGYHFHRALSLDVLGDLPPMDAALVDGDHNWYTVRNELDLLAQVARRAGAPLPVLVLHDVAWPYGRRDLYYDPDTIPAEHRQPHRRAGMRPGRSALTPDGGGMSAGHWNAEHEGGPRNGVMTALEDFLADDGRAVRTVLLPLYFGLAVVVDEARLAARPELVAALDRIESPAGKDRMIELGELLRVRAMANHRTVVRRRDDRIDRLVASCLDAVVRELSVDDDDRRRLGALRLALDEAPLGPDGGGVAVLGSGPGVTALVRAHLDVHDLGADLLEVIDVDGPQARSTGHDDAVALLVVERGPDAALLVESVRPRLLEGAKVLELPCGRAGPGRTSNRAR